MLRLEHAAVKQLLFISSISVFGNRNQIETETDLPEPDTESGQLLLEAETRLQTLKHTQVTILRFGGLTGPGRDLSRQFAGRKNIPNGLAPVNLIHLDDCIGITRAIIQKKAFGKIYHGVAPQHPGRAVYYQNLCKQNRQELPVFIMEKSAWKQIDSIHVPLMLNYQWQKNIL
ncbi:Protein YeeZ [compost metagenome]